MSGENSIQRNLQVPLNFQNLSGEAAEIQSDVNADIQEMNELLEVTGYVQGDSTLVVDTDGDGLPDPILSEDEMARMDALMGEVAEALEELNDVMKQLTSFTDVDGDGIDDVTNAKLSDLEARAEELASQIDGAKDEMNAIALSATMEHLAEGLSDDAQGVGDAAVDHQQLYVELEAAENAVANFQDDGTGVDVNTGKTLEELQNEVDSIKSQIAESQNEFLNELGDYLGVEGDPPSYEDLDSAYQSLAEQAENGELTDAFDYSILALIFAVMAQGAEADNAFRHSMMEANASFRESASIAGYAAAEKGYEAGKLIAKSKMISGSTQIAGGAITGIGAYKSGKMATGGTSGTTGSTTPSIELGTTGSGRSRSNAITTPDTNTANSTPDLTPEQRTIMAQQIAYKAQAQGQVVAGSGGIYAASVEEKSALAQKEATEEQTDQQALQSFQQTVQSIAGDKKAPELIQAMMTLVQQLHSTEQQIWS